MSRSAGNQTQTTTSEPPKFLQPYLETGAANAYNLYNANQPGVVGFSPQTQQALGMAEQRALGGSPVTDAAQSYATRSLAGGFMGQNPFLQGGANPHLDATFNQAARATQNQLTSEFARSGRNLEAREPIRADQLNNLATGIYGGAYDSDQNRRLSAYQGERGLQQGLIPFAGSLANQDYADIGQLANVGAQYEGLQREQMNQPGANLDAYLARLQGFPGGSVTQSQPMERNILAGALGGAATGFGSFGPWGALGGGILGGLYG